MTHADPLCAAFLGGDPLAGRAALEALVAAGDEGEERLLSGAIAIPTVQVRRRWLCYVATRHASVGPRLLARVCQKAPVPDRYAAADLFVGLPKNDPAHDRVDESLHAEFAHGTPRIHAAEDYWRVVAHMLAVGAGRDVAWTLWRLVERDSYAWEKLRTHAFRGVCCGAARFGPDHLPLLERFVTRKRARSGDVDIDLAEMWWQAYRTFPLWKAGSLVDAIFAHWSSHEEVRLRRFGAMILNAMAFRRAQEPLLRWIAAEQDAQVRETLVNALSQCGTPAAADALLDLDARGLATREAIAAGVAHASSRPAAIELLECTAGGDDAAAAEALVALARIDVSSRSLASALFSADEYRRLNAALAYGLLEDRSRIDDLLALQAESSNPMEALYVAAALAMLNHDEAPERLHAQLVRFAEEGTDIGDLYHLKPALRQAIVTAFQRAGSAGAPMLAHWKVEFEPLDASARPIERAVHASVANAAPSTPALMAAAPVAATTSHRRVPERFRVAFSFAGAQRSQVAAVAAALEERLGHGLVFFDDWFQAYVAGNDADLLLQRIYGQQSDLVVMCIAAEYEDRPWTMVEHRAVRALVWGAKPGSTQALRLLPLRFGEGDVSGVLSNTIAPDVRALAVEAVVELILARSRLLC